MSAGSPAGMTHRARRAGPESGSALVEFCFLGVLLMVPLAYVVLAVFHVQGAAYAVASATREAGRAFTTTDAAGDPDSRALQAAALAMRDHGLALDAEQLSVVCATSPCLTPGSSVRVTMQVQVPLPFLPAVFGDAVPASISVDGTHLQYVDRFRAGT